MSTSFDFSSYLPFTPSSQTPLSLCSSSSSLSSLSSLSPSSHSVVLLSIAPSSYPSSSDFVSLFRVLSPSGSLLISTSPESLSQLKSDLILSGFAEVSALNEDRGVVKATKPSWEKGAAAPLSFLKKPTTTTVNGNGSGSSSSSSKWTIGGTVEDDLVDEDDLLEREQEKVTKKGPTNFDCGTGSSTTKRKACKGCTCGLAEEEVAAEKAGAPAPQKEVGKGCGSCGLGDAFRCSTCPFLGQPAFSTTVGDKVKLEL